MAIDYGRRRCGIAVTDPLRIVATALETVETPRLCEFVSRYVASEDVDVVIVGEPHTLGGAESESMRYIRPGVERLRKVLPERVRLVMYDERFTSVLAHQAMIDGGTPRMRRRDKGAVDRMSAAIILNEYLQSKAYQSTIQ